MRWTLVMLWACAPPERAPDPAGELPDDALTVEAEAIAERASPLLDAHARLTPDGPVLDGALEMPVTDFPVLVTGDAIALLWDAGSLRLVLWVERHDLPVSPVSTRWIGAEDAGVRLPAGTPVTIVEERGTRARIVAEGSRIDLDGWVDGRALDRWWYDDPEPPIPDGPPVLQRVDVHAGSELVVRPGGATVGWVRDTPVQASVVDEQEPWRRVVFADEAWAVDAWVHAEDTRPAPWRGIGGMGGSWRSSIGCGVAGPPNVADDALLYDGVDGTVVGRLHDAGWYRLEGSPGGWRSTSLHTPFGTTAVWIAPVDILPGV